MRRTRDLYLRALGLVYLVAFASLASQADGLFGSHGIAPAAEYLARVRASSGGASFLDLPTLFLWDASDGALRAAGILGMVAAGLLMAGLVPLLSLCACVLLYLSLTLVGGPFLRFQWDALLIEAGVTALLVTPLSLRLGGRAGEPHPVGVMLQRYLLFRLMLLSGWVKLASHDATWRDLSALDVHFFTQPLPPWTAWLAHQLPPPVHRVMVAVMFAIELGAPWFAFAPRRARMALCLVPTVGLMVAIAATGNYGFFNLLTVVLCIPLLEDVTLARLPRRLAALLGAAPSEPPPPGPRALAALRSLVVVGAALLVLTVSVGQVGPRLVGAELPPWQQALIARVAPFHAINTYGLFASMTTERDEIELEGSLDGKQYRPYRFRWKPGPPGERPRFAFVHMPRLDWQMWFAALGDCRGNPWLHALARRILEGSPAVLSLLDQDPFAAEGRPPRYVRMPLQRYRFTDVATWRRDGTWWTRQPRGEFCPEFELTDGALSPRLDANR